MIRPVACAILCLGLAASPSSSQSERASPSVAAPSASIQTDSIEAVLLMLGHQPIPEASPEEIELRERVVRALQAGADELEWGRKVWVMLAHPRRPSDSAGMPIVAETQHTWSVRWTVRYARPELLERLRASAPGAPDDRRLIQDWFDEVAARMLDATRRVISDNGLLGEWSDDNDFAMQFVEECVIERSSVDCDGAEVVARGPGVRDVAAYQGTMLVSALDWVEGRAPSDVPIVLKPTRALQVELIPDKATWVEGERIGGKLLVTNSGTKRVSFPVDRGLRVLLRSIDDEALPELPSTMFACGGVRMDIDVFLEPGQTTHSYFSFNTDPLNGFGGVQAKPDKYKLSLEPIDPWHRVEVRCDPAFIEVVAGEGAIGERIIDWATDGRTLAVLREDRALQSFDLETARPLWSGELAPRPENGAEFRERLVAREDGVSLVTERVVRCGYEVVGTELSIVPVGAGPVFARLALPSRLPQETITAPIGRAGPVGSMWHRQRGLRSEGDLHDLVSVDLSTGAVGRYPVDTGEVAAISTDGVYAVRSDAPAGFFGVPPISVRPIECEEGEPWRPLLEPVDLRRWAGDLREARLRSDAWFAGRHGVYGAVGVREGIRFVSYDGSRRSRIESKLDFPIAESRDGRYIAVSNRPSVNPYAESEPAMLVEVWDVAEQRRVLTIDDGRRREVCFAPGPALIAARVQGDFLTRWRSDEFEVYDLATGRVRNMVVTSLGAE